MSDLKKIYNTTKNVYEEEAKAFDKERGKSLFEKEWLDKFISLLPRDAEILDVGCGPGKPIAEYFINQNINLTGIDYSQSMIDLAQNNFPENKWLCRDMTDLKLNQNFNGIIAWNSFFHLKQEDQKNTLKIFSEHLLENGVLIFTAGPEKGEVVGKVNDREVYHSSLDSSEYKSILSKHGLDLVEFKLNDPSCGYHCVFLAQKI